jgi:ubiquinone/menaquinone biosynthesis C-methylase UbiE
MSSTSSQVFYDQWKTQSSPLHAHNDQEWIRKYNDEILFYLKDKKNIMEGACGNGSFILDNFHLFDRYVGIDFSSEMIRNASQQLSEKAGVKNVKFIQANILEIDSLIKEKYDVFFSNSLLQYLNFEELVILFQKSYNLIEDDGFVLHLNVPNKAMRLSYLLNLHKSVKSNSVWKLFYKYIRMRGYVIGKNLFGKYDDSIGNWFTMEEINKAALLTNFSVEFFYSIYPPYSYRYHIKLKKIKK